VNRASVIRRMVKDLDRIYGGEDWEATRSRPDAVEAIVRTILSQNTNDANRDRGYDGLRSRFCTWNDVRCAHLSSLRSAIRPAGLAGQKAPAIRDFLRWLHRERGALEMDFLGEMPVDEAVEALTAHKGIGLKTAYILLAFSFGKDLCAVDTHVHRIMKRVGVINEACGRERAHTELRPLIPKGKAIAFHVNLLDHGKAVCTARNPDCGACAISDVCRFRARSSSP
jgi:endonuclease III